MIEILIAITGALCIGCAAVAVMAGHQAEVYQFCGDDERVKKCLINSFSCLTYIILWMIGFGLFWLACGISCH